jgi:hypothetical protein
MTKYFAAYVAQHGSYALKDFYRVQNAIITAQNAHVVLNA